MSLLTSWATNGIAVIPSKMGAACGARAPRSRNSHKIAFRSSFPEIRLTDAAVSALPRRFISSPRRARGSSAPAPSAGPGASDARVLKHRALSASTRTLSCSSSTQLLRRVVSRNQCNDAYESKDLQALRFHRWWRVPDGNYSRERNRPADDRLCPDREYDGRHLEGRRVKRYHADRCPLGAGKRAAYCHHRLGRSLPVLGRCRTKLSWYRRRPQRRSAVRVRACCAQSIAHGVPRASIHRFASAGGGGSLELINKRLEVQGDALRNARQ